MGSVSIVKNLLFSMFVLILVSGCSTVKVPMQVTHPAEICMTKYKAIAIGDIDGNLGRYFGDGLKNNLVESDRFKVVDRSRMNQIMAELNMSQSDLSDSKKRLKLGKMMCASAMIAGHTEGNYKEELTYENRKCGNKKDGYYNCKYYTRTGVYSTSGSVDVIDIETGEIIRSKVLNAKKSDYNNSYSNEGKPASIDRDSLTLSATTSNVDSFLKAIAPWTEIVQAPFITDGDIPELERGINQIKIGDSAQAITTFANAAKAAEANPEIDPETIAIAYFNLGLAYNFTFDFNAAIDAFKKAYALDSDDDYLNWLKTAKCHKADHKKLLAQEQGNG